MLKDGVVLIVEAVATGVAEDSIASEGSGTDMGRLDLSQLLAHWEVVASEKYLACCSGVGLLCGGLADC